VDPVERVGSTPAAATELSRRAPTRAGDENFPVALRLLGRATRGHLLAVYGFARLADDLGDEALGDRTALLDWLDDELDRALVGRATDPVLVRLGATVRACGLPEEPLRRLIEANRRDQVVGTYPTWDALAEYCTYSAQPVGRLVLAVFGRADARQMAWSDEVCTGLQLVEHLQDVGEDAGRGRVYLPAEDLVRFGCTEADLHAPTAGPALRAVVAFEVERARDLLRAVVPLAGSLTGRPRFAVAGFAAGGLGALEALERADFDVLGTACRAGRGRVLRHLLSVYRSARR
jgi:squalene synthase HpnC